MKKVKYTLSVKLLRSKIGRWLIKLILKRDFKYINFKGIDEYNFVFKLKEKRSHFRSLQIMGKEV